MIYLDNAATTSINKDVIHEINNGLLNYGNPSSLYDIGKKNNELINNARKVIAQHINCNGEEIIFTSSGSESDNMAIKGFFFKNYNNCT